AREKFGRFEDRKADFAENKRGEDFVGGLLNALPERGLGRQEITCSANRLKLARLFFFFGSSFAHLAYPARGDSGEWRVASGEKEESFRFSATSIFCSSSISFKAGSTSAS